MCATSRSYPTMSKGATVQNKSIYQVLAQSWSCDPVSGLDFQTTGFRSEFCCSRNFPEFPSQTY